MSKQPTSKRQWRDGAAPSAKKTAKPFKSKAHPKGETRKTASQPYGQKASDDIKPQNLPKQRAAKAKKLVVRNPNQKIMEHARDLKERRSDLSRMEPERLQKVLAASGVGSRREMEEWINNGWVTVNGKTAQLGDKVTPDDHVTVKGSIIKLKWADRLPRIILYYKQEGEIVSRDDPQGRVSIFDRLPQAASSRWVAIGRLDINTSGLLILTTSGELVQRFAHPSFEVEREYAVRVLGGLTGEQMRVLTEEGVMLEDGLAKVERIREQGGEGANKWYNVVIKEGRNREVRRIFESQGLTVSRLVRVGFGPIGLPNRLKRGQFYELNPAEVANIIKWADMLLPGERRRKKA
ncbi:TPA: pseudouridine synthase [Neisseria meningitidis]